MIPSKNFFFPSRKGQDNRGEGRHEYFFSHLKDLPEALRKDVGEVSFLTLPWRQIWEINLWMGAPSLTAPIHYDLLHNFFVQVPFFYRFLFFNRSLTMDI